MPTSAHPSWLPLLNLIAGIVYTLAMPFVALVTTYVYFDAQVRDELDIRREAAVLPVKSSM